jgi:hypothetical protein
MAGLLLPTAGPAGGADERIVLGLAVQVIEPGLTHGGDDGGNHPGLLSGVAGLCPEHAAKTGWRGSCNRTGSRAAGV